MNSIIINMEVLRGAVTELSRGTDDPTSARAAKYLDAIETEIRRLDKVIRGFLDLSSATSTSLSEFDVNLTVQHLSDFMSQEFHQKGVDVDLHLQPHLPPLHGNEDQIKQALINLLLNALEALPHGGKIAMSTAFDENEIRIEVFDNGSGIDERLFTKIFNPYFTTKAKGSGLGLTIVKRVVKDHGGEISLRSETGKGTSFVLKFPVGRLYE